MPVDKIDTRHEDKQPEDVLAEAIEAHEKQGHVITSVVPMQNRVLVVYTRPKRETRTTKPAEKRG